MAASPSYSGGSGSVGEISFVGSRVGVGGSVLDREHPHTIKRWDGGDYRNHGNGSGGNLDDHSIGDADNWLLMLMDTNEGARGAYRSWDVVPPSLLSLLHTPHIPLIIWDMRSRSASVFPGGLPANRFRDETATIEMDDNTRDGIVAIVSGVITALLSWFGMVLRLKSRDRKREEDRSDREEAMRIGALGEANVRLFDELKRQIAELKTECEECNRGKAEIFAHVIAQQAWMIKVEAVMREKGIYIEKPPMISPKMAMDGSM